MAERVDHVAAVAPFLRRVAERIRVQRDLMPQWSQSGRTAALFLDEASIALIDVARVSTGAEPLGAPAASQVHGPRPSRRRRPEPSDLVLF